ncbi:glycosyltransferase family 4 protein [Myroides sp. WP-1]|uniref:glycosyltransferase family 4 protein n=1 Tax=Myroides sp. WP-1 TaxID=2759944 RepID=UPI0015FCF79C|nr:glycosyltransferase family 4 protein [Myroides sp. WP-1]MBB1140544.1 glycosyltransferase family 4 protein [Myroides sp. WP-1]
MITKNILFLSFYFEPDLCAGSFRNSPLLAEVSKQLGDKGKITVITTKPNRYSSFKEEALSFEEKENYTVHRIQLPSHQSGMKDQIFAFKAYYQAVKNLVKNEKYDLVYASSSRLFTAYLGYTIAKKQNIPLYLDIRDIFVDTMSDVLHQGIVKKIALPVLKKVEKKVFSYATHINLISEGFKGYFDKYETTFSYFPNGIDDVFLENKADQTKVNDKKVITYAGNIGQGQGLHKIIPKAAKELGDSYVFQIIGDGGAKQELIEEVENLGLSNVVFMKPVRRNELIDIYNHSDYLFIHLNDFEAFEKVLPSKIFELATFKKPIIAGVGGFAYSFMKENVANIILFKPCDVDDMVRQMNEYVYRLEERNEFKNKFKRTQVNQKMAETILQYLK